MTIWSTVLLASLCLIASAFLNFVFAWSLRDMPILSALRILLFVAFGLSIVNLANVVCFSTLYVKRLRSYSLGRKRTTWSLFTAGTATSTISVCASGVTLVWLVIRRTSLPTSALHAAPIVLLGVWFGVWGVSLFCQALFYSLLAAWTKKVLRKQRTRTLDLDFGIRTPSMSYAGRPSTQRTNQSFGSHEATLTSPPRTPVSRGGSIAMSSATRVGPASSKTKLIRYSDRSSYDTVPFPAGESRTLDSAFDNWDTSSVHHEMRAAIHSSPPATRPATRRGLEPIPGSRPDSPADALDGPFLPQSPVSSSPPHAATSDTATVVGWSSSPRQPTSSPPSSPPNFSRPTSSGQNKAPPPPFHQYKTSIPELIHPLFRPNSPHPPPVARAGTMVTASPLADQPITPQTLARLRSKTDLSKGHWKTMPSIDKSESESDNTSPPSSPTLGSPGPSIVDDAELPPILPGFVLSAGSRSSLVGYGKRKSVKKERRRSQTSVGSRLSQLL